MFGLSNRIPTVKLKIPGKAFLKSESRTSVTFKFFTLELATSGSGWDLKSTLPWKKYEKYKKCFNDSQFKTPKWLYSAHSDRQSPSTYFCHRFSNPIFFAILSQKVFWTCLICKISQWDQHGSIIMSSDWESCLKSWLSNPNWSFDSRIKWFNDQ